MGNVSLPRPSAKVKIAATEGGAGSVEVQFNPKDLQVDKQVSWTSAGGHDEDPKQEFKEPQSASLSCTLFFDAHETKTDVYNSHVKTLESFAKMDPGLGRPPVCTFSWGKFVFKGVVESVSQKYSMFLDDGTRVRCEVGFKMKSAIGAEVATKK